MDSPLPRSRKHARDEDGDEESWPSWPSSTIKRLRGSLEEPAAQPDILQEYAARLSMFRSYNMPSQATFEFPQLESPSGDTASSSGASSIGSPASLASLPNPPESPEIDMMVDEVGSTNPPSPEHFHFVKPSKPSQLKTQPFATEPFAGGHVPTPIFPSFPPGAQQSQQQRQHSLRPAPIFAHPATPGFFSAPLRAEHPMPSPIREAELDAEMEAEYVFAGSRLSALTFGDDGACMDVDNSSGNSSSNLPGTLVRRLSSASLPTMSSPSLPVSPTPPAPPRTGRARSGAITERRRFFMGYRDDCEKCRLKVPNHFAHFITAS